MFTGVSTTKAHRRMCLYTASRELINILKRPHTRWFGVLRHWFSIYCAVITIYTLRRHSLLFSFHQLYYRNTLHRHFIDTPRSRFHAIRRQYYAFHLRRFRAEYRPRLILSPEIASSLAGHFLFAIPSTGRRFGDSRFRHISLSRFLAKFSHFLEFSGFILSLRIRASLSASLLCVFSSYIFNGRSGRTCFSLASCRGWRPGWVARALSHFILKFSLLYMALKPIFASRRSIDDMVIMLPARTILRETCSPEPTRCSRILHTRTGFHEISHHLLFFQNSFIFSSGTRWRDNYLLFAGILTANTRSGPRRTASMTPLAYFTSSRKMLGSHRALPVEGFNMPPADWLMPHCQHFSSPPTISSIIFDVVSLGYSSFLARRFRFIHALFIFIDYAVICRSLILCGHYRFFSRLHRLRTSSPWHATAAIARYSPRLYKCACLTF